MLHKGTILDDIKLVVILIFSQFTIQYVFEIRASEEEIGTQGSAHSG